jgi:predicted nucleic acid-binding protein
MESAVLIDSSVFIDLLRAGLDPGVELLRRCETLDLATCGMVQLEVLRGVAAPKVQNRLIQFMSVMLYVPTDNQMWEEATRLGWQLGREGWNLPAQDIVIAACARRIGAAVLTYDKHFTAIPELRVLRSLDELE